MDKLAKLIADIGKLWGHYSGAYFTGIQNTLILAVAATLAGCLIGLLCPWVGNIPWRRKWQSTPVFLLGKSHRQRNPAGYSRWCHKESDTTERLNNNNNNNVIMSSTLASGSPGFIFSLPTSQP